MVETQILLVEDDNIIAMELEDRLQNLGYTVCATTSTGEDAIEKTSEMRPDLVLMDIKLQGAIDGVEAAAEIHAHFDIPVIYLTAYADKNTLQRARITEPYGYIIKPFGERDLHTAIEMALYKHAIERKLKESERWLSTTLRSIGDAVIACDETGAIALMNSVAEILTGWNQTEALGRNVADIVKIANEAGYIAAENPVSKALQSGLGIDLDNSLLLARDRKEIPIDGSVSLLRDDKGNVQGTVLVFRDITDRKREEEERERLQVQLFQAQRMEALGALAGGLAHDFNNLLTTIIGYSSLILSQLDDDAPHRKGMESIQEAGERAASLSQQTLALSNKEKPQLEARDLQIKTAGQGEFQGRGERVLLVEDDASVRATVSDMLHAGGYIVLEAASAEEALDIFEREPGKIDLVFSEVVLPHKDGLELADELLSYRSDLPILLTSGYLDERAQRSIIHERGMVFVQKPYCFSSLMTIIRKAIPTS